jgi:hypothetical protein
LPYLLDEEARVCRPIVEPDRAYAVPTGLALIRDALATPRSVVRLTGLSGMGKTRFAQALFDPRVGTGALDASLAVYGDAGYEKAVSPGQLARSLVEDRVEAVLVVDNCPASRHSELTAIARTAGSRLRLLTIDFDVGDDQPEHTDVFRLQNAGEDLIDSLLRQRAPQLTQGDRHRIVEFSGGNTRIALAIALAPRGRKGIAHLRNDELLDRLFLKGRRDPDVELRRVARAASLVYAFSVSGADGDAVPDGEPVDERVRAGVRVSDVDAVPVCEGDGVPVVLPVADEDGVTLLDGLELPVSEEDAPAVNEHDGVPVALAVPTAAIQQMEGNSVVFVKEGERYTAMPVTTGHADADMTEITEGIAAGVEVVGTNSFIIKADIGKASAEHED